MLKKNLLQCSENIEQITKLPKNQLPNLNEAESMEKGFRNKLFTLSRKSTPGTPDTINSAIHIYNTDAVTLIEEIVNKVYCLRPLTVVTKPIRIKSTNDCKMQPDVKFTLI